MDAGSGVDGIGWTVIVLFFGLDVMHARRRS
jgi:hypothetical protein